MVLRVALLPGAADTDAIAALMAQKAQDAVRVRPRVEFVSAQEIYHAGQQTKAKRFIDQR